MDSSYESATNKDRTDKDGSQVDVNENLQKANEASINKLVDGDNLKSGGMNIELVSNADKQVTAGGVKNSGTHINISGALNADKISVNNVGTNNLSQGLFTGSAGGISVNGAVGILNLNRNASTTITGILSAKNLTINNQDDGNSEQEILQGGFGLLAAANVSHGALNVTGKNNITIAGSTLDTTTLNISNSDDSKINVNSKGVTVSAGRAIGVLIAEGSLEGKNEIEINNATLKGDTISIRATAAPEVNVDALALSAGAAFAGSGLFAGSINDSSASIIGNGATFTSNDLNINAENISTVKTSTNSASGSLLASGSLTGILNNSNAAAAVDFQNATVNAPNTSVNVNSSPSQKVGLVSLGAGGLLAATGSIAGVISNPSATANMSTKEITADDLKITAVANSNPEISVKGLTVGAIASGSNLIQSVRNVNVDAKLKADSATLNSLDINAKTNSAPNLNVNGDGGGLVGVAPLAAVLNDTLKQSGAVNLDGTFNIKNSVKVNVQTSDAGTYKADALGAAVIGASGVELKRSSDSKAAINFNNADIKTEGSQNYTTINELGYSLDLEAAGAVETVISNSEINTTFDNQININSSTLATEGDESAIKLTSGDLTEQKYHTIANIQGGALGIGLANTDNTLNRSNAVKLNNSAIDAANNVYLLSGESKLTMTTFADVYNKTVLPLSTAPTLKDNLKINNTVDINSGSTINAARNVNIKAQSGTEVITESAKEYNIYTSESGMGDVIVTTGREGNAYETANNFVNIDGTIINNTRGLQNVGEDPMLKYTFGSQKFSDWLQEAIVTKKTSWFDGYKKDSDTETLTFKNYEHYLNFVYNMALKYDTSDLAAHRQYLSDAAGTSSWYKGNFNADWTRWKNLMLAKYDTASTTPTGAIVSGGAVSVIAKTLNINGLIQSGFNNYVATINAQAITNLQRNGNKNLDNDAVIGDNRFKVNTTDAETVYNSQTGVYDKVVGLYYNPKTNNVLTDPLQVSGGVIYLKAQDIVSTGNGKIIAAGGGADITIDNQTYTPLVVKDINTTTRPDPLIMINGVDYTKKSQYLPNSKAVYAWTGGINYRKIETKSSESKELFWGLVKVKSTEELVDKLNTEKVSINTISTSIPPKEGSNLQTGVFTDYSGGNVNVESDLETGANGTINLTSKLDDIITSSGSKIIAPKVILNAGENIDVTLGLPETKSTELKVTSFLESSRAFDIKITANTPIKNIDISGNKNVNIVGLDDVSGKISAKKLEITTPGNIDLTTQISDTLTAQGDKSVKVTQTSGDIKIGKVASKGNVTLTASNGAIVNSVDTAVNMTGAADKIAAWQAAGLISDKDSDNSATNSAQAEKNIRLAGLENLFKRWALKDDGTVDETLYRQFVNNTADTTKLTDEQINQLELYQDLQSSTDYGFSKNQLLYAVQESLLNASAGITASISDPIITGKNITLNAKSLGKALEPVTYSDLTDIKTLEKLAGVKGGDVTINDKGSITVKAQSPITIAQIAAQDKLNITTQGNTFVSGTTETKFNMNTPINAGNKKVVLMTGNGIDAMSGISAKDIELYAGAGDLNAKIISGKLTANALNNIAISADSNLLVNNVTSGSNATLTAIGNISSGGKFIVNAPNVNLTATNNIGTQSIPLFILADDTALKEKYAYIMGDYGNLNAAPDTKVMVGSNGEAAGSPESTGGNTNSNISYYSPAQSSTETTPTNEAAPVTNTYEPLNTPSVINSAEPANATPANNFTTRTISQLDKFSHSLNHNEPLSTESVDDDISADNFAAKITNQFDFDDILPPVNTVSEDDLTANKMLITLPDENLYILNVEGLDNETEPPLSLTQNKEHYVLALALSKSATLNKKSGSIYETLAKSWLDGMGYSEEAK